MVMVQQRRSLLLSDFFGPDSAPTRVGYLSINLGVSDMGFYTPTGYKSHSLHPNRCGGFLF